MKWMEPESLSAKCRPTVTLVANFNFLVRMNSTGRWWQQPKSA
jgi:hypothetical protein